MFSNRIETWQSFYQSIKSPEWPNCWSESEFYLLPEWIRKEILELHDGAKYLGVNGTEPLVYSTNDLIPEFNLRFSIANDFDIIYDSFMNGGGTTYAQNLPAVLKFLYPERKFHHCLDWCSGAGFIGFRLVSDGVCQNVTMLDAFQPSLDACKKTWEHRPSRLSSNHMQTLQASTVTKLDSNLQFDLIVGNPPNFDGSMPNFFDFSRKFIYTHISQDPGWKTHTDFFLNIAKNLTPDGVILLIKHVDGSQPEDHEQAIKEGGLKINKVFVESQYPRQYYIELSHQ